ncbi:hypothetical protein [Candidatus Entotheonella palauensis]|uniref:hypothetical protein n=1 Tax=Candidatus Entotheonella palauensis TaxID=93172 RepID=UPI000B7E02C8|nr:hypothetical protein [Candidatus Entotheonella palauensis]
MVTAAVLSPLPVPQEQQSGSATGSEASDQQQQEASKWEKLWSKIAAEGYEGLKPQVQDPSLRPVGDTCGMRRRGAFRDLPRHLRHAFQVAAFSNVPATRLALLQDIVAQTTGLPRFRAYVEMARTHIRQRRYDQAAAVLDEARHIPIPPACQADLAFLQ